MPQPVPISHLLPTLYSRVIQQNSSPMRTMDVLLSFPQPSFKHDPLPDPASHFRLLEILDDHDDDRSQTSHIKCELTTWPADPDTLPSYHAISYTWGEHDSNIIIRVNGKPFPVRTNCEFVLRQARRHGQSRYYWVDAICIDQSNLDEKSKQVVMMGNIYRRAAHVLACVGDHAQDSLFFCKTLRQSLPAGQGKRWIFNNRGELSWRFRLGHRSATSRRLLLAAARFAMRPYFTRLWILQELHNAQDVSFLCGMEALPRDDVRLMLSDLHHVLPYGTKRALVLWPPAQDQEGPLTNMLGLLTRIWGLRRIMPQELFTSWSYRDYLELSGKVFKSLQVTKDYAHVYSTWKLLDIASCLKCADKKDKVYGIISIIDWGDVAATTPDYAQTEFEVAVDFIHALTKLEEALREDICLQDASFLTTENLNLKNRSCGVADALRARRGNPERAIMRTEMPLDAPLLSSSRYAVGWCLSADCLDQRRPDYSIWSPMGHGSRDIYLPRWARPGDWVIQVRGYAFGWFGQKDCPVLVVMREMADALRGPLIGRGFGSIDGTGLTTAKFQIHWDAEDLVILCLTVNDPSTMGQGSDDWLESFLDVSICRQQTPGSSYAIRRNDV